MRRIDSRGESCRRGIASIEFALVAPILCLMMAGVFELGSLIRVQTAAHRLAMQYAYSFANCPDTSVGACQAEILVHTSPSALANIVPQLVPSQLSLTMLQVQMNGTAAAIQYQSPTGSALSSAQTSALQAVVPSGQTGVVVSVSYRFSPMTFPAIMTPLIGQNFTIVYNVVQLK